MTSPRWTRRHFLTGSAVAAGTLATPWRTLALPAATLGETAPPPLPPTPGAAAAVTLPPPVSRPIPLRHSNVARPLRYTVRDDGFHIRNGRERFNRPLYPAADHRVRLDAGDLPEFRLILPGGSAHLRLGITRGASAPLSLAELADISALYRDGRLLYTLRDRDLLGHGGELLLEALPAGDPGGAHLVLSGRNLPPELSLTWALRVAAHPESAGTHLTGELRLHQEHAAAMAGEVAGVGYDITGTFAAITGPAGELRLDLPPGSNLHLVDAATWPAGWQALRAATPATPAGPHILIATLHLPMGGDLAPLAVDLCLPHQRGISEPTGDRATRRRTELASIANRVRIRTPDPVLDASLTALNVAAQALWLPTAQSLTDSAAGSATASPGWSAPPGLDALGLHTPVRAHLRHWFNAQNTDPLPPGTDPDGPAFAAADPGSALARKDALLRTNGDLGRTNRDADLSLLEALIRHLRWTGDLTLARELWPALLRSMDRQYRLFRREFPDPAQSDRSAAPALALYESYGTLSAEDSISYSGAGVAHATARNLFLNREAAVLARILGEDAVPFDTEANLLHRSMRALLWQPGRGCFAEARDTLFPQALSPEPGLWTASRVLDCESTTPRESWQIAAERSNACTPIPVCGPGISSAAENADTPFLLPSSTWQACGGGAAASGVAGLHLDETLRMALALARSGDRETAWRLLRGAVLDATGRGLVPGNLPRTSSLDPLAGETGVDHADTLGALARAVVEGLFGVEPNLLHATLTLRPGFPTAWTEAELKHPDLDLAWSRSETRGGSTERFTLTSRLPRPVALTLLLPARGTADPVVLANGIPFPSRFDPNSTGTPTLILTDFPPATAWTIEVHWQGRPPLPVPSLATIAAGQPIPLPPGATIAQVDDPQGCVANGLAAHPGHRSVFLRIVDGHCGYWLPIPLFITGGPASVLAEEAPSKAAGIITADEPSSLASAGHFEPLALGALLDSRLTDLFTRSYVRPRSPFCSLSVPEHLLDPNLPFPLDDTGLRTAGGTLRTAAGVPFLTPGKPEEPNCRFLSFWADDRDGIDLSLTGRAVGLHLLITGTTLPQATGALHGSVRVRYTDGSEARLDLRSPENWWPAERDLLLDDFLFRSPAPPPARLNLRTGRPHRRSETGDLVAGGAASILHLALDPARTLGSLRLECKLSGVIVALLAATLQRGEG